MTLFGRPRPGEVFTPGDLPLKRDNVYISRAVSEEKLTRGLSRNACPVVFGDYGAGKTTLVRRYFRAEEKTSLYGRWIRKEPKLGRVVYFSSAEGLTLAKVFETILDHLQYRVKVETSASKSSGLEYGGTDGFVSLSVSRGKSRNEVSRLVISAPTDESLLRIIDRARLVIIIDELHRSTPQFRAELVSFVKATRVSAPSSQIVLIGTVQDAADIVAMDEGVDRFVADTPVGTMSSQEARALVGDGFAKLSIAIEEPLLALIIEAAAGAPATLQALCLDVAEHVVNCSRREVIREDVTYALQIYIEDRHSRMTRRYLAAIETQGSKRYRKQILHSVAALEGEYATMEQIRDSVSVRLEVEVKSSTLSGPLKDLKSPEFGNILQDFRRDSGERVQNVSNFTDPMMKSYVRFMETVTKSEILDEDEVRMRLGGTEE